MVKATSRFITPVEGHYHSFDLRPDCLQKAGDRLKGKSCAGYPLNQIISKNLDNKKVISVYLNGEDLNNLYDQIPKKYVINFGTMEFDQASQYVEPFQITIDRVKPYRDKLTGQLHESRFWLFWDKREKFYKKIKNFNRILVTSITTKYLTFSFVPTGWIYSHAVKIFAFSTANYFAVLQSYFHDVWAREYSSTLGQTLRYSTNVFETFPFPIDITNLTTLGENYHSLRRKIMQNNQEGLTKTYNRFHDPKENATDIQKLRDLHVEMDEAVAAAYGWQDLKLEHGFHDTKQGLRYTLSEAARREVLDRLLRLNHERYAEEVRQGLHDKKGGKGKAPREEAPAAEDFSLEAGGAGTRKRGRKGK